MREARKSEYFVDGFLIKHFGVWPHGIDKHNLFEEQRIFLVYLMGCIPDFENWSQQMNYQLEIADVDDLKEVEISQTDLDIAKLQGQNIEEIKRTRLIQEKKKRKAEINKRYGVRDNNEPPESIKKLQFPGEKEKLWKILEGHGLIRNGLQDKT